ncbi:MAG: SEC-C domain-containing protein [Acidobacteriota bacterium]|nr:SEC-C domain-containing protein [Acidobacteriota bacterium]
MPAAGRNEPCPCGSGRKFKQCCGGPAATTTALPTRADRDAAFALLDRLSGLRRFEEDVVAAYVMIWGAMLDREEAARLMETPANDLFLEWIWFDHLIHTGQTIAEYALERHAQDVGPGARYFLRACTAAPLRLLQVHRVEPGRVHVRDVVDKGAVIVVSERLGSEQLVRHDVLAARIARYDDEMQFEGMNMLFGIDDKLAIAAEVRRLRRPLARELPAGAARDRVMRMAGGAAIVISALALYDRPRPRLTTVDGDELALADAMFSVTDLNAVRAALDDAADIEPDDGTPESPVDTTRYSWLERPRHDDDEGIRILGSVVLDRTSLRIETMSMARARRAQEYFGALAGETALRFKAIQVKSVEAMLRSTRADPNPSEPEIDPAVAADIERAFYEKHYREWLDLPVPALDHRTPREAARVKRLHAKLLALVEGIENQAARQHKEGRGFDTGYLRTELGLPSGQT